MYYDTSYCDVGHCIVYKHAALHGNRDNPFTTTMTDTGLEMLHIGTLHFFSMSAYGPVSWSSQRQTILDLSTTPGEYVAASEATLGSVGEQNTVNEILPTIAVLLHNGIGIGGSRYAHMHSF